MLDVGGKAKKQGLSIFRGRVKKKKMKFSLSQPFYSAYFVVKSSIEREQKFYEDFKKQNYMCFIHSYNCYLDSQNEISSYTYYGDLKHCFYSKRQCNWCPISPRRSGKQGLLFLKKYIESWKLPS